MDGEMGSRSQDTRIGWLSLFGSAPRPEACSRSPRPQPASWLETQPLKKAWMQWLEKRWGGPLSPLVLSVFAFLCASGEIDGALRDAVHVSATEWHLGVTHVWQFVGAVQHSRLVQYFVPRQLLQPLESSLQPPIGSNSAATHAPTSNGAGKAESLGLHVTSGASLGPGIAALVHKGARYDAATSALCAK
jgi:hypothetical protein